jgi:hypothetical protein
MGVLELSVEALHVGEELGGQLTAGSFDRCGRSDTLEESDGVGSVEFLGDSAWRELHQQVVQAAHDPGAVLADVDVALRQEPKHLGVISGRDLA